MLYVHSLIPSCPREDYAKGVWGLTLTFLGPEVIKFPEFTRYDLVGQKEICYAIRYHKLIDGAAMEVKIPRLNVVLPSEVVTGAIS